MEMDSVAGTSEIIVSADTSSLASNSKNLMTCVGEFVMDMLADQKQTQTSVQMTIKGVNNLVKKVVDIKIKEAITLLRQAECEHTESLAVMQREVGDIDLFCGLKSQHSQQIYFSRYCNLIMPTKIKLPSRPEDYGRVSTGRDQKLRKQDYTYVPLLPQLEKLLQMEDVYKVVTTPKQNEAGTWMNYEDGTNYRNNDFFQRHPTALQLHLYIDEVQMCNAIGSYTHKIVFVYFSIANLPA